MGLALCHHSFNSVRASLDRIHGLGKKGYGGVESTGTSISMEVHAKSGSRGINLVCYGLADEVNLISD